MEVDVALHSDLKKLPADVTLTGVSVTDSDGRAVRSRIISDVDFRAGPGSTTAIRIQLDTRAKPERFHVPSVTERAEYDVKVEGRYQVLPKDLLGRVTTKATAGEIAGTQRLDASRTYGWSVRRLVALLLAAALGLLILAWVYKRFLQLPRLVGVFVLDKPASDTKAVVPLQGKRQRLTGKDVPGAGAAKIEVFTRRGKPRHVYAKVETPPFYEVEDRRREKVVTEETEIRLGRYRLGGGRMKYQPKPPERD